jgi:translation initiation factor 2 beta subunit (eIF-2beta)/eIF-5
LGLKEFLKKLMNILVNKNAKSHNSNKKHSIDFFSFKKELKKSQITRRKKKTFFKNSAGKLLISV